jgi:tetratricopeptide (TPR) repeat protein
MFGLRNGIWQFLALAVILGSPLSLNAQATSAGQYFAAANQLYSSRNFNQAIQYYGAVVKTNPNYSPAYQGIANCYYALGNKQYALAYYQRAYQLSPNAQLGQLIQSLQAQAATPAYGMGLPVARPTPVNASLAMGMRYFQARQYAAAIPYFQQATRQIPNNYRPFYYLGYCYYMANQQKYGALYIGVADMKQPNASVRATADKIKANLSDDDALWVDDQLSKYSDATGLRIPPHKYKALFGFDFGLGMDYLYNDPNQITQYTAGKGSVSLTGVTPSLIPLPSAEFFVQVNPNIELDLSGTYLPIGTLSYTWTELDTRSPMEGGTDPYLPGSFYDPPSGTPNYYKLNYTTSIFTGSLGFKLLFGDPTVKAYFGAGADISPVSLTFQKTVYNGSGQLQSEDASSSDQSGGDYTTVAFGGHAVLGANFILSRSLAFGPYIGYKYLDATNFKNPSGTLSINQANGDVGSSGVFNNTTLYNTLPVATVPLDLDLSGIFGGLNVSFAF